MLSWRQKEADDQGCAAELLRSWSSQGGEPCGNGGLLVINTMAKGHVVSLENGESLGKAQLGGLWASRGSDLHCTPLHPTPRLVACSHPYLLEALLGCTAQQL